MKILFQGDSITDAGRSRENDSNLGSGYPKLVSAALGYEFPKKFEFVNKGISGDKIVDLYARIKRDIINYAPDVMSILIGVNDVWHDLDFSDGVDAQKYYKVYSMLIEEIRENLPDVKIMILEPFVLKAKATEQKWEAFCAEVKNRACAAKKIADEYNLVYVPLQAGFDELAQKAPASYWLKDGVHPTYMGHEYIKRCWIKAFKEIADI